MRRWSRDQYLQHKRRNSFVHPKRLKPMDLSIVSRQAVREHVARNLLAQPNEGEAGAVRRTAERFNFTEETVREIVAFVEEATS